jgi:hypothetical protein
MVSWLCAFWWHVLATATAPDCPNILSPGQVTLLWQPFLGNGAVNTPTNCWETIFSVRSGPRLYNEEFQVSQSHTYVEAGSNTYTMTLRVVGGNEKESLKSETVKYGHEPQGTRTWGRLSWRGPAAYTKADPSSRQRGRPTKTSP